MGFIIDLLVLPFKLVFWFVAVLIGLVGRLVVAIIGFALLIVGIVVSLTIVGAIVGVPLALLGLLLMIGSIS